MVKKKINPEEPKLSKSKKESEEDSEDLEVVEPGADIEKQEVVEDVPKVEEDVWEPKTDLGKQVKSGKIKDIDMILDKGERILEMGIVDKLLPDLKTELLLVGQAKGKFGGGQRRVFMQTQKKTREGNKPKFATYAIVGDEDGHVGLGKGKAKETVPAREKAIRKAKLNIIKIKRGCGSWECNCKTPHSIPFGVVGEYGSVKLKLFPAPKGTGLKVEKECQKILELAGIKDVWSKKIGGSKVKTNLINACIEALSQLSTLKLSDEEKKTLSVVEGRLPKSEKDLDFDDLKDTEQVGANE